MSVTIVWPWEKKNTVAPAPPLVPPALPVSRTTVNQALAILKEKKMSTAPVTHNGFVRFIDGLENFFKHAAPVVGNLAEAARPILALTPYGPEYNLALTGIETAVQADIAVQKASATPLTGVQKMALAVAVATPGITQILAAKGVHETSTQQTAIAQFLQNVYSLQTGPVAARPAVIGGITAPVAPTPTS